MSYLKQRPRGDQPAHREHQERVRHLVAEHGEVGAADELHVSRYTLGRLLGGLPLREATRALLRERLGPEGDDA